VVAELGDNMSITDVNRTYVVEGKASIIQSENSLWIDCGTPDALLEASQLAAKGKLSPEPCNYRDGDAVP
jgi:dTDP-glucose pyrophosphorylase